jgi:hypothetical protein
MIAGTSFKTYKQRGEWVELLFMTRAAGRGFNVSKPWGDSARYDVSTEDKGRFVRVQIKSTARWNGTSYCCALRAFHQNDYSTAEVDYFAAYVIPADVWYIFPGAVVASLWAVVLTPHRKGHKYERYMEAWDLLRSRKRRPPLPEETPKPRKPRRRNEGLRLYD